VKSVSDKVVGNSLA